jgi:glycosyltransferase involved in cell wall biosynthesis
MKVLALQSGPRGICTYRIWHHAHMLKQAGHEVHAFMDERDRSDMEDYGITFNWVPEDWFAWAGKHRPDAIYTGYGTSLDRVSKLEALREACGIPFIVDYDDLIEAVPGYNEASVNMGKASFPNKVLKHFMKVASATTTTTEFLRDMVDQKSHIVPNFVMELYYNGAPEPHDTVRIIFTGASGGRWGEMEFLRPVIESVLPKYPNARMIFCGGTPVWALKLKNFHAIRWCEFPAFNKIMARLGADIGLAPLLPNDFNRGKSAIKYYEYGMTAAAGIYSDLDPYHEVRDGVTGMVVPHDVDAWKDALTTLIESATMRTDMARAAKADVQANHTSSDALERVLKEVTNGNSSS